MSESQKPIKEQIADYFVDQIDNKGYNVNDKASFMNLRKNCMTDLNLKKGSFGYTEKILYDILKDRGIAILDDKQLEELGKNIKVKFESEEKFKDTQSKSPISKPPSTEQLESQTTGETKKLEKKEPLPESVLKENKATLKELTDFLGDVYASFGLIEGEVKEKPEEPQTKEQWQIKADEWGDRLAGFCYRHNLELPMIIEVLALAGSAFIVFGMPIVKVITMKTEKVPKDESLKDTKTEVKV